MKIDKSKLSAEELAALEAIEKRAGIAEDEPTTDTPTTEPVEKSTPAAEPTTGSDTDDIYKGLHPAVKAELEANQALLEEQKNQLGAKWDELDQYIDALDGEIATGEETLDSLAAEQAEAEKAFQAAALALSSYLEAQNQKYHNPTMYCSLDFGVPLQTYSRLTTDFGAGGHLGHDIAAPRGTPIYAVADGIVTAAGYHNHPQSYGNYVQVLHGCDDEGNEYSTLYAHMCDWPSVSEGQTVVKGQILGYVGNTGYSFGNHLHLEMKINGRRVDALDYCPLP